MTRDLHASREASGPTTLSSLAHSGSVARPRSRLGLIVGASAIVVGGAIGSALALRMAPASAAAGPPRTGAPAPAPPAAAPSTGTQTAVVGPGATPSTGPGAPAPVAVAAPRAGTQTAAEANAALVAQIKDALRRFVAWSHAHPGARCPDAAALGAALDPWGQPLRIVCSDQPVDQVAGVLSYGPDGEPGTRDDVVSWALGADVTALARGPRWSASRGMAAAGTGGRHGGARPGPRSDPSAPPLPGGSPPGKPPKPPPAGAGSNDTDGDGIPDRR